MSGYPKPTDKTWTIQFKGERIELTRGYDNLWRDPEGCVYAFAELSEDDDPVDRCGVGVLSLSPKAPITYACKIHDYQYSSPAYQAFYSRGEADRQLRRNIKILGKGTMWGLLAQPFKTIVDIVGSRYWDNKKTDK